MTTYKKGDILVTMPNPFVHNDFISFHQVVRVSKSGNVIGYRSIDVNIIEGDEISGKIVALSNEFTEPKSFTRYLTASRVPNIWDGEPIIFNRD